MIFAGHKEERNTVNLSLRQLQHQANVLGFRPELLEKVILLQGLLQALMSHPIVRRSFVLKGGTALNMYYFSLPRLSVDLDLNFIGALDKDDMLEQREYLQPVIIGIAQQKGLSLYRNPNRHAGGKMIFRYPSVLGHKGFLEVDLNYLHRLPLWPIEEKRCYLFDDVAKVSVPILNIYELTAGKLATLFSRAACRDLYDVHQLLHSYNFDWEQLRLAFVIYGAMNSVDWRSISCQQLNFTTKSLQLRLLPMLRKQLSRNEKKQWCQKLANDTINLLDKHLLPLRDNEIEFLTMLLEHNKIQPELISDDEELNAHIKQHPALLWKIAQKNQAAVLH